eukprot:tig00000383_g24658.t1
MAAVPGAAPAPPSGAAVVGGIAGARFYSFQPPTATSANQPVRVASSSASPAAFAAFSAPAVKVASIPAAFPRVGSPQVAPAVISRPASAQAAPPAPSPPSRASSSSGHQSGEQTQAYSRKDKSLGLLCENFLKEYGMSMNDEIQLDQAAERLGVERRRIYDIVNVLESIEIVVRKQKNCYAWLGLTRLPSALDRLREQANAEKFKLFPGLAEGQAGAQAGTAAARPSTSNGDVSGDDDEDDDDGGRGRRKGGRGGGGGGAGESRKDRSLGILSQRFVQLFLLEGVKPVVSLEQAGRALHGSQADEAKMKAPVRRLYDIANILSSLHLVEKVHVGDSRKPSFKWLGAGVYSVDGTEPDLETLKRKAGTASILSLMAGTAVKRQRVGEGPLVPISVPLGSPEPSTATARPAARQRAQGKGGRGRGGSRGRRRKPEDEDEADEEEAAVEEEVLADESAPVLEADSSRSALPAGAGRSGRSSRRSATDAAATVEASSSAVSAGRHSRGMRRSAAAAAAAKWKRLGEEAADEEEDGAAHDAKRKEGSEIANELASEGELEAPAVAVDADAEEEERGASWATTRPPEAKPLTCEEAAELAELHSAPGVGRRAERYRDLLRRHHATLFAGPGGHAAAAAAVRVLRRALAQAPADTSRVQLARTLGQLLLHCAMQPPSQEPEAERRHLRGRFEAVLAEEQPGWEDSALAEMLNRLHTADDEAPEAWAAALLADPCRLPAAIPDPWALDPLRLCALQSGFLAAMRCRASASGSRAAGRASALEISVATPEQFQRFLAHVLLPALSGAASATTTLATLSSAASAFLTHPLPDLCSH